MEGGLSCISQRFQVGRPLTPTGSRAWPAPDEDQKAAEDPTPMLKGQPPESIRAMGSINLANHIPPAIVRQVELCESCEAIISALSLVRAETRRLERDPDRTMADRGLTGNGLPFLRCWSRYGIGRFPSSSAGMLMLRAGLATVSRRVRSMKRRDFLLACAAGTMFKQALHAAHSESTQDGSEDVGHKCRRHG